MNSERQTLAQAALGLGLNLEESALDRLLRYLVLLQKWNRVHNLTAVREPAAMLSQHLLDSLSIVRPLERTLAKNDVPVRLLDVGSGAGLPGVVLAIAQPWLQVTCVDAVEKKSAFTRQAALELRLPNLIAIHGRVEQLAQRLRPVKFEVVTARAFASLEKLIHLTEDLLSEQGVWLAMKGQLPTSEVEALRSTVDVFHVEHLVIPTLDAQRCIVWMRRKRIAEQLSRPDKGRTGRSEGTA